MSEIIWRDPITNQLWIDGWITQQYALGRRPIVGYPMKGLPDTGDATMKVVTGFMADSDGGTSL